MTFTVGIRGAGLAGLSLAQAISARDPSVAISLFDIRDRHPHLGRTFCFFDDGIALTPAVPRYSWSRVALRGNGFVREISVEDTPYTMIRGEDYFALALQALEDAGVSFTWGCRSVEIATPSSLLVDGEVKRFDVVIDAAFRTQDAHSLLWQSFAGEWITADSDIFDPECAVLMDLGDSSGESPVSFIYVLPTSARTALIEHTTFSVRPMDREVHLAACHDWIERNIGNRISRGAQEHGCIPMGLATHAQGAVLSLGTMSGAVRPATGYAFHTIQRQALEMAELIISRKESVALKERAMTAIPRWMVLGDILFLKALVRSPSKGSVLMGSLLSRAPSKELVAFLSGTATFREVFRVWSSVSKVSMMRALVGL